MATIGEVIQCGRSISIGISLYGAEAGFLARYKKQTEALGRAIAMQVGLVYGDPRLHEIAEDTPLGVEAEALFQEFRKLASTAVKW